MLWDYLTLLKEIRWGDLLDIGLASGLLWFCLHALRSMRTRKVGIVLLLYAGLILVAGQLELKLSMWILQGLTAVIILIVVVVYQSEIRRMLERFPASILGRHKMTRKESQTLADLLVNTLDTLAAQKVGALIVLAGADPLHGIITAGTPLEGHLSKALVLSLFDPNSPGHDGALIIREDRVERFGSRLPLSDRDEQLKDRGTRHAAALGLSEKTDALVLVVSEETGQLSVAREGRLKSFAEKGQLRNEMTVFLERHSLPEEEAGRVRNFTLWNSLEGLAGLLAAAALWLILVPGSVVQIVTYDVAVEVQNIPEGYALESVTPERVAVILTGEKRNFFPINPNDLVIQLDGTLTGLGRRTYPITKNHLLLPPNIEIVDLVPEQVRVTVQKLN